jgi:hypothetical protein
MDITTNFVFVELCNQKKAIKDGHNFSSLLENFECLPHDARKLCSTQTQRKNELLNPKILSKGLKDAISKLLTVTKPVGTSNT